MSFVEKILPYERNIFLWLNEFHSPYWDRFMWLYSSKEVWIPLAIVAFVIFVYKTNWKEALLIILCACLIGFLADFVSATFLKPYFERLRPTYHPDFKYLVDTVNGYIGGQYGFISNHAANGFSIATFTSLLFRYKYYTITIISWALITAYSRIYLGVHFISDVIGGAIWGFIIGYLVYYIYLKARRYILKVPIGELKTPIYSHAKANILISVIIGSMLFISIYSLFFNIT